MSETPERIEFHLLLEGIFQRYGYDFRNYAPETLIRRLQQFQLVHQAMPLSDVTARVLRDPSFFYELLPYFSISYTMLFREPSVFMALREHVVPLLRSWPRFKIWHAGCATGEEVYSLAILLREMNLLDRAMIYATDISQPALDTAKQGIYSLDVLRKGNANYLESGGSGSLSDHYHAQYNSCIMDQELRSRITFARHNLAIDQSFGDMQLILCRNVLMYFNHTLQERVLQLFSASLERGGYLCIGSRESLVCLSTVNDFEYVHEESRIFRKCVSNQ
jgi:chemotaxis protein methyltransferase CheR